MNISKLNIHVQVYTYATMVWAIMALVNSICVYLYPQNYTFVVVLIISLSLSVFNSVLATLLHQKYEKIEQDM